MQRCRAGHKGLNIKLLLEVVASIAQIRNLVHSSPSCSQTAPCEICQPHPLPHTCHFRTHPFEPIHTCDIWKSKGQHGHIRHTLDLIQRPLIWTRCPLWNTVSNVVHQTHSTGFGIYTCMFVSWNLLFLFFFIYLLANRYLFKHCNGLLTPIC
jgi:hypothetical protein